MDPHEPASSSAARTSGLRPATRIAIALLALAAVFGAVLVVELATGDAPPPPARALSVAPSPLLPGSLAGYTIRDEPSLAEALREQYRASSVAIRSVEAAAIPLRATAATLLGASLDASVHPESSQFQAGVLAGAAHGFGIDPSSNPFRPRKAGTIDVYTATAPEGRLFVWFFRDAFVQLFVPERLATEADEIQRVVLEAQLVRLEASRR